MKRKKIEHIFNYRYYFKRIKNYDNFIKLNKTTNLNWNDEFFDLNIFYNDEFENNDNNNNVSNNYNTIDLKNFKFLNNFNKKDNLRVWNGFEDNEFDICSLDLINGIGYLFSWTFRINNHYNSTGFNNIYNLNRFFL